MLILSRRPREVIWIGKDIQICVLGIDRGQVKIGIQAPSDVEILREELLFKGDFYERSLVEDCEL